MGSDEIAPRFFCASHKPWDLRSLRLVLFCGDGVEQNQNDKHAEWRATCLFWSETERYADSVNRVCVCSSGLLACGGRSRNVLEVMSRSYWRLEKTSNAD